jgi:hypothetical protein
LCSALLCSPGPLGVLAMRSASRSSHSPLCSASALPPYHYIHERTYHPIHHRERNRSVDHDRDPQRPSST